MRCDTVKDSRDALRDGSLSRQGAEEVRQHLAGCSSCAREWEVTEQLRQAIRERASMPAAPPAFREAMARLLEPKTARAGWTEWLWQPFRRRPFVAGLPLAVAVALLVLLTSNLRHLSMREAAVTPLVEESVNEHVRLTLGASPPEISGHELQPLRDRERERFALPRSVSFPDDHEFHLIGGQGSSLLDRRALAVTYRKADRAITVLVMPGSGIRLPAQAPIPESKVYRATHRGYRTIHWQQGPLIYSVVSDADEADLSRLAEKLQQK